jgi:hypothetical protein
MHIWQDCPHLTTHCLQDIAHGQCKGGQGHYWALHVSPGTWLVVRKHYAKTQSWVSRFAYVRRVIMDPTTHVCKCSCLFHERHGIPCRHLYLFLTQVRTTDFDVRWWVRYGTYYGEIGTDVFYLCAIDTHHYIHRHPKGHEEFTDEVDNIRVSGQNGPIVPSGKDSAHGIGFVMGLESTDNAVQISDLIHKMNKAPHPIVVNMDGGTSRPSIIMFL